MPLTRALRLGPPHLPPCLVTDAGDYSLAEWPMKRARWVASSGMLCPQPMPD